MKVCILSPQYFGYGKIGGFGSMSRMLAESLAARGVEVSAVVPKVIDFRFSSGGTKS